MQSFTATHQCRDPQMSAKIQQSVITNRQLSLLLTILAVKYNKKSNICSTYSTGEAYKIPLEVSWTDHTSTQ